MTLQFVLSSLLPLLTFAALTAVAGQLARRQLLAGRTRIALPLFAIATVCELLVLVVGWFVLFDESGRLRPIGGWEPYFFTVVAPLGKFSALIGAIVMLFGVRKSASE